MKSRLIRPALFIAALLAAACSDDNGGNEPTAPFSLGKNYYETRLEHGSTTIPIMNGSGDIDLAIGDEAILQASYKKYDNKETDGRIGHITLYGKRKGATTLTIADRGTKEVEHVEVKVTDSYLAYVIAESDHPALKAGTALFWVNNAACDCYAFAMDEELGQPEERPAAKGRYGFFAAPDPSGEFDAIPCLRLAYDAGSEGGAADDDAAASYDFRIELQSGETDPSFVLNVIRSYLGVDWEKLADDAVTKAPQPVNWTMILTVPGTDHRIKGELSIQQIPEHILE